MPEYRRDFLEAVEHDRELWQSLDVRRIAVFAEGAWRNLATQVTLTGANPEAVPRLSHQIHTPEVRADQHVLPVSALADLVQAVVQGRWPVNEAPVLYCTGQFDDRDEQPYQYNNQHFHQLDFPHVHPALQWSGHVLYVGRPVLNDLPASARRLQRLGGGRAAVPAAVRELR